MWYHMWYHTYSHLSPPTFSTPLSLIHPTLWLTQETSNRQGYVFRCRGHTECCEGREFSIRAAPMPEGGYIVQDRGKHEGEETGRVFDDVGELRRGRVEGWRAE